MGDISFPPPEVIGIDKPHVRFCKYRFMQMVGDSHDRLEAWDAAQIAALALHRHVCLVPFQNLKHLVHIATPWNDCVPARMEQHALHDHFCMRPQLPADAPHPARCGRGRGGGGGSIDIMPMGLLQGPRKLQQKFRSTWSCGLCLTPDSSNAINLSSA